MSSRNKWWKEATVYQIYPRSFNDTNDDGIGDLRGIIEKLDYLDDLGIDVVWLNPVYASPMVDNGCDISDYRSIHPDFGTMTEWEQLRDGLHDRDIRLIMDLVVNHTSDEHEWFQKSRREEGKYGEYYIWRDSDEPGPPTTGNRSLVDRHGRSTKGERHTISICSTRNNLISTGVTLLSVRISTR